MKNILQLSSLFVLLTTSTLLQSSPPHGSPIGTYKIDTVRFVLSDPSAVPAQPPPGIWIDTNTKLLGLAGGTVKSSKPYGIAFDYTDSTFTFTTLEFSTVTLAYDDGIVEPSVRALALPLRIAARKYEGVNSVGGGQTVKYVTRILSGKIPRVVSQDEPFTLKLIGQFTKEDGSKVPFTIEQHYDIKKESTTKAAVDVLQDN